MVAKNSDLPTLLYVDDEEENLVNFKFLFRKEFVVYTALSAAAAYKILAENDIQVIIADQRMPGETGVQFLSKTAQLYPDSARMILTGYSDINAVIEAINNGKIYHYFQKPFNEDEVKLVVRNVIETLDLEAANICLLDELNLANAKLIDESRHLEALVQDRTQSLAMEVEERKRFAEELQVAKEAADKAKYMAEAASMAKTTFLANMSHELRTPLNAILGFTYLMTQDENTSFQQQSYLGTINRSGKYLLHVINDVLDMSKIEAGHEALENESFDLDILLNEMSEMFTIRANQKGLEFRLEVDNGELLYFKGDQGKIRQILINLLANAIKFTHEGCVSLHAHTQMLPSDPERLQLVLEVKDSGPGIGPEQQEIIFAPFSQLDNNHQSLKGTGLGLAITKSLVLLMGGGISVNSRPGQGAVFQVRLPVVAAKADDVKRLRSQFPRVTGLQPEQPPWRLLVVEDNSENSLLLSTLLTQVGFQVRVGCNGIEGVALFKEWAPNLILMDMHMPLMNGFEAMRLIRGLPGGEEVKILAITASAFQEQKRSIFAAGCDDVVVKPYEPQALFELIAAQIPVKYIHSDPNEWQPQGAQKPLLELNSLRRLPSDILQSLRRATIYLDITLLKELVLEIAPLDPELSNVLLCFAEECDFTLLDEALSQLNVKLDEPEPP